jgi:hypothetical protein
MSDFTPELGQAAFGNTPWSRFETPSYITDGLCVIASVIEEQRGDDGPMTSNYGGEFTNERFEMRAYCWCDESRHPDGCPPNFLHKPSGVICTWYKHASRGESINKAVSAQLWANILMDCLRSLQPAMGDVR